MPKAAQARDREGNRMVRIPYDSTGHYVVLQLLRRQDAWVKAENGVHYTGDIPETFTNVSITLPAKEASGNAKEGTAEKVWKDYLRISTW